MAASSRSLRDQFGDRAAAWHQHLCGLQRLSRSDVVPNQCFFALQPKAAVNLHTGWHAATDEGGRSVGCHALAWRPWLHSQGRVVGIRDQTRS